MKKILLAKLNKSWAILFIVIGVFNQTAIGYEGGPETSNSIVARAKKENYCKVDINERFDKRIKESKNAFAGKPIKNSFTYLDSEYGTIYLVPFFSKNGIGRYEVIKVTTKPNGEEIGEVLDTMWINPGDNLYSRSARGSLPKIGNNYYFFDVKNSKIDLDHSAYTKSDNTITSTIEIPHDKISKMSSKEILEENETKDRHCAIATVSRKLNDSWLAQTVHWHQGGQLPRYKKKGREAEFAEDEQVHSKGIKRVSPKHLNEGEH